VGEVPHVVEAYKKYHDKGFEIIEFSLDKDKQSLVDFYSKKRNDLASIFDGSAGKIKSALILVFVPSQRCG